MFSVTKQVRHHTFSHAVTCLMVCLIPSVASAQSINWGALLQNWMDSANMTVSGYRVLGKQVEVSSEKVINSNLQSQSAAVSAIVANQQSRQVRESVQRFAEQGVFPCYQSIVAQEAGLRNKASARAHNHSMQSMSSWSVAPDSSRKTDQIALHRSVYCSVSEAKAGLCKLDAKGMQSADSDFSMLIKPGTKSSSEQAAAYDYIDNAIPQRGRIACSSPDCIANLADHRASDVADSMARSVFIDLIETRSRQAP